MSLPITISEPITHPKLWRFTGFVSSIVGFSCYALNPSFKDLFGKWNPLKIAIYTVSTLLIFLLMLFVNKWKGLARTFLLKAHVGFLVLMLTSLYSFYEDRSEETNKEKAYGSILSLISCGAFALMSMSLARQLELGFEVGMFNFFLGCFLVTVMKMNFKWAPIAAIFCYLLVNFRSCSNCLLKILGRERGHADVECGPKLKEDSLDSAKDVNLSLEDENPVTQSFLRYNFDLNNFPQDTRDKLSLIKLATLIEVSAKKGTRELNLKSKLMDQLEWLPNSLGKLSSLVTLDLSENRIVVLPSTIGGLSSLTRLDLHSNSINELPDSMGDILSLVYLDLGGNQLSLLPASFGRLVRLEELDLSSNKFSVLPDSLGSLVNLKKLNVGTNDLEELPHSIGHCSSLRELHADYNRIKALPESVRKIQSLEVLSVMYNYIKQLPTTMLSLKNLRELNVSFNKLESVPEILCFSTSLVKMNIGNNFARLRSLPRSIGNLEMLEELDISNNHVHVLPDSFRMLTRLRVLRVEGNPLEVPPRSVAEIGAQAVVQYITKLVEGRDNVKKQPLKPKKS